MKRFTTVLLTLIALTVTLAGVAYAKTTIHCQPRGECHGSPGPDKLIGNENRNSIHGYAKADTIMAHRGNDDVSGGYGKDTIRLGRGNDKAYAGRGDDVVFAADGERDKLVCGKGKDIAKVDEVDSVGNTCEIKRFPK
jgi:Ca2+-binding RTX toxin-like protein